jgi:hypothetical protein
MMRWLRKQSLPRGYRSQMFGFMPRVNSEVVIGIAGSADYSKPGNAPRMVLVGPRESLATGPHGSPTRGSPFMSMRFINSSRGLYAPSDDRDDDLSRHRPKTDRRRLQRTIESMKKDGEQFVQSAGVELKFDGDDSPIDWEKSFSWSDTPAIVDRCMNKYRNRVPNELTTKELDLLVKALPGFSDGEKADHFRLVIIKKAWQDAYDENMEKVISDNLSSYEP